MDTRLRMDIEMEDCELDEIVEGECFSILLGGGRDGGGGVVVVVVVGIVVVLDLPLLTTSRA